MSLKVGRRRRSRQVEPGGRRCLIEIGHDSEISASASSSNMTRRRPDECLQRSPETMSRPPDDQFCQRRYHPGRRNAMADGSCNRAREAQHRQRSTNIAAGSSAAEAQDHDRRAQDSACAPSVPASRYQYPRPIMVGRHGRCVQQEAKRKHSISSVPQKLDSLKGLSMVAARAKQTATISRRLTRCRLLRKPSFQRKFQDGERPIEG